MIAFKPGALLLNLLLLILLLHTPIFAQSLPEKLNTFLQKQAAEKINLVTNKNNYLAGDTIFFQVNNFQQTADNLIEVQLIAPETSQSKTTQVLLVNGFQISYLTLPKEAVSGDYIVRAFSSSGWENSALISVYNPKQKPAEYLSLDFVNATAGVKLTLTKQANAWEIAWPNTQSISNSKGWLLITGPNQMYYSQEVDFTALPNKITIPLNAFSARHAQVMLALNSGEIIGNYTYVSNENQSNELQLKLNKPIYNNREPVALQVTPGSQTNKIEDGYLTVRILAQTDTLTNNNPKEDQKKLFFLKKTLPIVNLRKILANTSVSNNYIFVLKGRLISAIDKKPVVNSLIHALVPATGQMEVLYTNNQGQIQMELDPFEETKPILFRAIQEGNEIKNIAFIPDSSQTIMPWQPVLRLESIRPSNKNL